MDGPESIVGELGFMIGFFLFCFNLPKTFFIERKLTPAIAYAKMSGQSEEKRVSRPMILDKEP